MDHLELDKVVERINFLKAQRVLVQLPDGLKTKAEEIVDYLEQKTNAKVFIWFSSCFGACDLPFGLEVMGIDLMVHFGHNKYWKAEKW